MVENYTTNRCQVQANQALSRLEPGRDVPHRVGQIARRHEVGLCFEQRALRRARAAHARCESSKTQYSIYEAHVIAPSCRIRPSASSTPRCSTILPFAIRATEMPVKRNERPDGGMPKNSPVCVPVIVRCETT